MNRERIILHVDMDAFYAAVEVRENPELAGKPLVIGHRGRRGVVSTCSYEARRFGVHSAMPSLSAERLCPQAIWLPGRMQLYAEVSRAIRSIFDDFTPDVEPLSIDEAFLDLRGIVHDLEAGRQTAQVLKQRIRDEQHLTASVGVAANKFLAKIASDLEKPDGLVVIAPGDVPQMLWPLPIERLWGVGPKTAARLHKRGFHTVGDVANLPESLLRATLGLGEAEHLRALAHGEDTRPVETQREAKSLSEERTYTDDLTDPEDIDRALLQRAEGVCQELRRQRLLARTVHLKVRSGDFTTWTRAAKLQAPTDLAEVVVNTARALLSERIELAGRGVRLLGVGVSGFVAAGAGQASLFTDEAHERARRVAIAADSIRERLGPDAVVRARLLRPAQEQAADDTPPEASSLPSVD